MLSTETLFSFPKSAQKQTISNGIIRSLMVMGHEGWFYRFQVGPWSHDWNTTATKTASALEVHCSFDHDDQVNWVVQTHRIWPRFELGLQNILWSGSESLGWTFSDSHTVAPQSPCTTEVIHLKFTQTCLFHVLLNQSRIHGVWILLQITLSAVSKHHKSFLAKWRLSVNWFPAILNRNNLKPWW